MISIDFLKWDSDFFNKKIGKITVDNIDIVDSVKDLFITAKKEKYNLLYVFVNPNIQLPSELLRNFSIQLVDEKVTYKTSVSDKIIINNLEEISNYNSSSLDYDLEQLAYESGKYSRFKTDLKFDRADFYKLYKRWIENAVNKINNKEIFVFTTNQETSGMVTLDYNDKIGSIGLIAVSEESQGQGIGTKLIERCFLELSQKGVDSIEVVTQNNNLGANKLYQKSGFKVKDIVNIYHLWL
ncbi:MAG: GNAT family N-acetyltransferase [Bacteroidales bacterium]|nr:GNAT family N-acetyltransferase [Bacteroidales bacterium]NLK81474.1 GNAT family N-acetyltransferase [Bacteroidales bacterium]